MYQAVGGGQHVGCGEAKHVGEQGVYGKSLYIPLSFAVKLIPFKILFLIKRAL